MDELKTMNTVEEIEELEEVVEELDEMEDYEYETEGFDLGNLVKIGLGVGLIAGGAFAFRKKIAAKVEEMEVARLEKKGYLIHKPIIIEPEAEETAVEPETVEAEEVEQKPKKKKKS